MRPFRLLPLALAATAAAACGSDDGVGPEPGAKAQVSIDFCPSFAPTWLAIQNEGEGWQSVSINPSGPTVVDVTPKVSVATVTTFFGSAFTLILNITRDEISTFGIGACEGGAVGSRELAGSVAGLTGEQVARISVGAQTATASAQTPTWALTELPAGPIDLVATRYASFSSQPANRVIVRRNVMPGAGASVPALEFGGSESQALESATFTLAGASGDFVSVENTFVTANGTAHVLMDASSTAATAFGYVSVPAALRTSSDIHLLDVLAFSADGLREILHSYRAPTNKTFTLGPMVPAPSISTVASTPYRRLTAQVASQPQYSTALAVTYLQAINQQSVRIVGVMTTAAYLGGRPASWALTIPDLTSVGYQASWGLQAGSYDWSVTGFEGNAALLLGGPAADGATLVSAARLSPGPVSTVQARIPSAARSVFWRGGR